MDILYYSNYCKHSQKVVNTLVKNNLKDKLSFLCIDKRKRDTRDNQVYILLENGSRVIMPPNIHSVPSLLLVQNNYKVIYGDDIIQHYHPQMKEYNNKATGFNGEPLGYCLGSSIGGTNIISEKFTDYNMSPEELSAKGKGNSRQLYNYVSVHDDNIFIETPPDNYRPDKISDDITIDSLQQKRMDEINTNHNQQLPI
tara:strand:- start:3515 stop:4108 length:594 start_codon:yes stop_codon:yes gene_type:complete